MNNWSLCILVYYTTPFIFFKDVLRFVFLALTESTFKVLPIVYQVKFLSGVINELMYLDSTNTLRRLPSGNIMLLYAKAVQVTVYARGRVTHNGQLCVIFTPDLKVNRSVELSYLKARFDLTWFKFGLITFFNESSWSLKKICQEFELNWHDKAY